MPTTGVLGTDKSVLGSLVLAEPPSSSVIFVSASTSLDVSGFAHIPHDYSAEASTSFNLTTASSAFAVGNKFVSATTSFVVSTAGTEHDTLAFHVTGQRSNINLWAFGDAYVSPILVDAETSFSLSDSASALATGNKPVSAVTTFVVSSDAEYGGFTWHVSAVSSVSLKSTASCPNFFLVTASSSLNLMGPFDEFHAFATVRPSTKVFVSALTSFSISGSSSESVQQTHFFVRAASTVALSGSAGKSITQTVFFVSASTALVVTGTQSRSVDRIVRAFTSFAVSQSVSTQRGVVSRVFAKSGILVSGAAREKRDAVAHATTMIAVSALATSRRDLHVSATTSLALSQSDSNNEYMAIGGVSSFVVTASASAIIAGTPAHSSIVLTDLAQATVWLPWRRSVLSLPPGGGLPHS